MRSLHLVIGGILIGLSGVVACGDDDTTPGSGSSSSGGATSSGNASSSSGGATSSSSSSSSSSSGSQSSSSSSSGSSGGECTALAKYCSEKCSSSAVLKKDCDDTVAEGNETQCVGWKATNSSLCK